MRRRDPRNASMLLECVLVLPLLLLLICAVMQFAQIWTARQMVVYAAYCATRATLSVHPVEQKRVALQAARRVLAWVNIAGKAEHYGSPDAEPGEWHIPGWGGVPGSDSLDRRVSVKLDPLVFLANLGGQSTGGVAKVTVSYRFPLVMPVVGPMVSWLVRHGEDEGQQAEYRVAGGWTGEAEVLEEESKRLKTVAKDGTVRLDYLDQGVFPYLEFRETCVLPMPYSTAGFPISAEATLSEAESLLDQVRGGGS